MSCRICQSHTTPFAKAEIMSRYTIAYEQCPNCKLLQTEKPYWLAEAYENAINLGDTGMMQRNLLFRNTAVSIIKRYFNRKGTFLDYAAGYGIFVRLMQDKGIDFKWSDSYCENLFAKGLEYNAEQDKIELLTAFEVFEHFENPIEDIEKLFGISESILFSTELLPDPIPKPAEWWYYGLDHGQHIAFYSTETLKYLANHFGKHLYSYKNMHLLSPKKLSSFKFKNLVKIGLAKTKFC